MYIQPISNNEISFCRNPMKPNSWSSFKNSVKQKVFDALPNADFKNPSEGIKKVNERISRPAENRAIMGVTAIALQPAIDGSNKKVDEKTRKMSVYRTIAKIVVGTLVGIIVRGSAYSLVKNMTNINGTGKYSKYLLPSEHIKSLKENPEFLANYRSALSTATAICAMIFTNFAIDAPLTVKLTNRLTKNLRETENVAQKEQKQEVKYV